MQEIKNVKVLFWSKLIFSSEQIIFVTCRLISPWLGKIRGEAWPPSESAPGYPVSKTVQLSTKFYITEKDSAVFANQFIQTNSPSLSPDYNSKNKFIRSRKTEKILRYISSMGFLQQKIIIPFVLSYYLRPR